MGDVVVREYRDSDRVEILALVGRFTEFEIPPWRSKRAIDATNHAALSSALSEPRDGSAVLVAEGDATFCGFIHLQTKTDYFSSEPVGYVADIAVHPDCEGRGVAGRLLDEAARWAREQGLSVLTLSVFENNKRAIRLYEKHGFAPEIVHYARTVE